MKQTNYLSLVFFVVVFLLISNSSFSQTYYGPPFRAINAYDSNPPFNSIDETIDHWWSVYQQVWSGWFPPNRYPGCYYTRYDYPDGVVTGRFAGLTLEGGCSGGQGFIGTAYPYDLDKNNGNPDDSGNSCTGNSVGNPVNAATGNKFQPETDLDSPAFRYVRYYNSKGAGSGHGSQWRHTYSASLRLLSSSSASAVLVNRPDGKVLYFQLVSGVWRPDADINDHLISLSDANGTRTGWQYAVTANGSIETYDAAGHLLSIRHRGGLTETLTYTDGLLNRVTDSFGRTLSFGYDTARRIVSLNDPDGRMYQYGYDSSNNLISVQYPDGATRQYLYNEPEQTGGTSLPHALTGIIDENGSRYATFSYDAQSRAIASRHAGGAQAFSFAYDPTGTTVTDPLGTTHRFGFETILGVMKKSALDQPCTLPGCAGNSSRELAHDTNGNLTAHTDFNGTTTAYTYDTTRNLTLSRTEAAGTPLARTTTTTWHATYRLPTRIEAPLTVTDFAYDADGNLLSKTETARDSGAVRTWTYTYDAYGRVLSVDGPRTDVQDVTRYAYDSAGNLATVTNAAGQVLSLGPYDASGRLLKSVDANGKTTEFSYGPRGWLLSRTVDGWQTQFSYDALGQLVQYTPPTGSWVQYGYDAAHRLARITNKIGQSTVYEHDAAGNIVREEHKGTTDNLLSYEQRQFDAFGRLARILGNHGQFSAFGYDAQSNPVSTADAAGRQTQMAYDALGRATGMTDAAGGQTTLAYDADDRLTQGKRIFPPYEISIESNCLRKLASFAALPAALWSVREPQRQDQPARTP